MDTIKELEETKHRLEIIKMARELLNEEYINRRAQDHNKWLVESDRIWKLHRINLPYPPFASYPTDEEIVAKATVLYEFVNKPKIVKPAETQTHSVIITQEEKEKVSTISPMSPENQDSFRKTYLDPDTQDNTPQSDLDDVADASNISGPIEQTPIPATLETTESSAKSDSQTQVSPTVSAMQSLLPGWVRRTN